MVRLLQDQGARKGSGAGTLGARVPAIFQYPNTQRASTIWYHDHTLGMTRLNVYAGPAGFFIIRGGPAGDLAVRDTRTRTASRSPVASAQRARPDPAEHDLLRDPDRHPGPRVQRRWLALLPGQPRLLRRHRPGPYIPDTDVSPIWNPEFFGNTIMVNGNTWPFLNVEQRRYRFRFLNGCDARFLILNFGNIPGVEVWQIGNEGGFLAAPVNMTAVEWWPVAHGPGRTRRCHRGLHQRAGGQLHPRQYRPG